MGRGLFTYDELIYYPKKSNERDNAFTYQSEVLRETYKMSCTICAKSRFIIYIWFSTCFYENKLHHATLHKLKAISIALCSVPCT